MYVCIPYLKFLIIERGNLNKAKSFKEVENEALRSLFD